MGRWCSVCLLDGEGRRHSLDIQAESTFDAASRYTTFVRDNPTCGLPIPTLATTFEVNVQGKLYSVHGEKLQKWMEKRRRELNGPAGMLFKQRAMLSE
jgi:hypothetical protein